jgi:hypothetical protein
MMKNKLLIAVALGVLMLPMSASAAGIVSGQQIKVLSSSGALGGGAFGIDVPVFDGIEDFRTFCVERTETLQSPGGPYFVEVSHSAFGGGVAGGSPDPLDTKTAYLYSQFLSGAFGALTKDDVTGLQLAIWRLEQELDSTYGGASVGASAAQVSKADYFYGLSSAANGSLYGIRVMRLWTGYDSTTGVFTGAKQDLLVQAPDGGATVALLGCALMGLGLLRRKIGA